MVSEPQGASTWCLGLGSNLGDRRVYLRLGLEALGRHGQVEAISGLYETAPVGYLDQPDFLNAACLFRTALEPHALLEAAKEAERDAGRTGGPRYGPRTLDIDLLLWDRGVVSLPDLIVPHPRLAERAFALLPLAEVAPDWVHPLLKTRVTCLAAAVRGRPGVRRIAGPGWA